MDRTSRPHFSDGEVGFCFMAPVFEVYLCEISYQDWFEGEKGEGRVTN